MQRYTGDDPTPGGDQPGTRRAYERAERDLREGRQRRGLEALQSLADARPAYAPACFRLALLAFRQGDVGKSLEFLERAIAADPRNAGYQFRLGFVRQHAGRLQEAVAAYCDAARLDPGNVAALVKAGVLLSQLGERERGAELLQRAVLVEPGLDSLPRSEKLTPPAREEISNALGLLRRQYRHMVQQLLDELGGKYPPAERRRIERAFRMLYGEEAREYNHPQQRPEFFLLPEVPAVPWFEREHFEWVPQVEEAWGDIRRELENLLAEEAEFMPYIEAKPDAAAEYKTREGTDFSALAGSGSWTAFHLNKAGVIQDNCLRCPDTMALMKTLPLPEADKYMPEIFFSRLAPGAHIIPHYGQMNFRLTVHLGLVVPEGCGIRVGDETRHWEAGRVLAFDDSFEHEAWNRGDSQRIVLIFEVWHPDIREAEIAGLQMFFRQRAEWMERCSPNNPLQ